MYVNNERYYFDNECNKVENVTVGTFCFDKDYTGVGHKTYLLILLSASFAMLSFIFLCTLKQMLTVYAVIWGGTIICYFAALLYYQSQVNFILFLVFFLILSFKFVKSNAKNQKTKNKNCNMFCFRVLAAMLNIKQQTMKYYR